MSNNERSLYIGIMSGTSMDGIDASLCDFSGNGFTLVATASAPLPPGLRKVLTGLQAPGTNEIHTAMLAANELAHCYGELSKTLLHQAAIHRGAISAIGCHGQTIRHQPAAGYTVQINNGALLAEITGIDVVCDFRSRDIAAGGQGAPLVPAFHQAIFGRTNQHRAMLNIGGMANVTDLPINGNASGFDCGPGNVLMDEWISGQLGRAYDDRGQWAASGSIDHPLLERLLNHPFFAAPPPKSCGREDFNMAWLRAHLASTSITAPDVQATLLELSALTIARAVEHGCVGASELIVCGGGAKNTALFERLSALLPNIRLCTSAEHGLPVDAVESAAFAWLAQRCMTGLDGNLPRVTGARGGRILGAIYRH